MKRVTIKWVLFCGAVFASSTYARAPIKPVSTTKATATTVTASDVTKDESSSCHGYYCFSWDQMHAVTDPGCSQFTNIKDAAAKLSEAYNSWDESVVPPGIKCCMTHGPDDGAFPVPKSKSTSTLPADRYACAECVYNAAGFGYQKGIGSQEDCDEAYP